MLREIRGFHQDELGAWVAELSCGHAQHLRHCPPWQNRAWVEHAQARQERLGTQLDCPYCNMAELPGGLTRYKRTPSFDAENVPAALLKEHRTKAGVWAEIITEQGRLEYTCARGTFVLRPGIVGIVEPEQPHHVRPLGATLFHVVFLRADPATADSEPHA
jgi:tellurite methyltransferase